MLMLIMPEMTICTAPVTTRPDLEWTCAMKVESIHASAYGVLARDELAGGQLTLLSRLRVR